LFTFISLIDEENSDDYELDDFSTQGQEGDHFFWNEAELFHPVYQGIDYSILLYTLNWLR
jgi:hypothetical protein